MSDIEALDNLIEAVEAGTFDARKYPLMKLPKMDIDTFNRIHASFYDDMNAALSLKDALLPHWAIERLTMWPGPTPRCTAELWGTHDEGGEKWHSFGDGRADATAANIARALLLATLKAWRAKLEAEAND